MTADRSLLEAALSGYEIRLREVNGKIAEIRTELARPNLTAITNDDLEVIRQKHMTPNDFLTRLEKATRPNRQMSDAASKRIGAAQKRRWAVWRKTQGAK